MRVYSLCKEWHRTSGIGRPRAVQQPAHLRPQRHCSLSLSCPSSMCRCAPMYKSALFSALYLLCELQMHEACDSVVHHLH